MTKQELVFESPAHFRDGDIVLTRLLALEDLVERTRKTGDQARVEGLRSSKLLNSRPALPRTDELRRKK